MINLVVVGVETPRIKSGCSLENEFNELICMNPLVVLYLTINQVDSCHGFVYAPLN